MHPSSTLRQIVMPTAVAALLMAPAAQAGTSSILRWFQDGCAETQPIVSLVQICERGSRAGAPCQQMPEFDPGSPKFSTDCCLGYEDQDCNTSNFDTFCSDPSPRRNCSTGRTGRLCVTNEGCDTGICTRGNDLSIGDECSLDSQCGADPNGIPGVCDAAGDGSCGAPEVNASNRKIGQVLRINDEVALLAVVVGIIETAQPHWNRKDRRLPDLEFELAEIDQLKFVDDQICALAAQLGPLAPTSGNGNGSDNGSDPNSP